MLDITERKRGRGPAPGGRAEVPHDRRAEPGDLLHAGHRSRRSGVSRTTYIAPRQHRDARLHAGGDPGRPDAVVRRSSTPTTGTRVFAADAREQPADGDAASRIEYRMISKDGRIVWVQDEAALVQLAGRAPLSGRASCSTSPSASRPRSSSRAPSSVEREATRRLRALDEMKNTFLQAVSHDLRTPLAAILGLAITLERGDVAARGGRREGSGAADRRNARRLDRLVTNLLDLDRLARGIVAPKLAADRRRRARPARAGRVRPDRRCAPGDRPPAGHGPPVDAAKVERIVENLLANTVRHTPSTRRSGCGCGPNRRRHDRRRGQRARGPGRAPRHRVRAVPPGARSATALARRRRRTDAGAPVRRAARRPAWVQDRTAAAPRSGCSCRRPARPSWCRPTTTRHPVLRPACRRSCHPPAWTRCPEPTPSRTLPR